MMEEVERRRELSIRLSQIFDGEKMETVIPVLEVALAFAIVHGVESPADRMLVCNEVLQHLLEDIASMEIDSHDVH